MTNEIDKLIGDYRKLTKEGINAISYFIKHNLVHKEDVEKLFSYDKWEVRLRDYEPITIEFCTVDGVVMPEIGISIRKKFPELWREKVLELIHNKIEEDLKLND